MNTQPFSPSEHLSATMIAGYLDPTGSPAEKEQMAAHCVTCAVCREQLALVAMALSPEREAEQEAEFAALLRVGEKAARQVRPKKKSRWFDWFLHPRPVLATAAVTVLLAVVLVGYSRWQRTQPLERSLASLRQAWTQSRPIEARVTGDFPYLPYQVTRSANGITADKPDQLMAATAELSREVADKPSSQAHQALGKLHLLKAEFAEAEKKLRDAIQADPNNAAAYVDLAALFYERGLREPSILTFNQSVENSQKALALAPKLPEAWFNLALCHERMMLTAQAISDWEEYLKLDARSAWADEARRRLADLKKQAAQAAPTQQLAKDLRAAHTAKEDEKLRSLISQNFSATTDLFRRQFLNEYLAAILDGKQEEVENHHLFLQHLTQLIEENKAERFYSDLLASINQRDIAHVRQIRDLQEMLGQADEKHEKADYGKATLQYAAARKLAVRLGATAHEGLALYGLARIYLPENENAEIKALRKELISLTAHRQHQQLQAKALLALANQYGAEQLFDQELKAVSQAHEISRRLSDWATAINALRFWGFYYARIGMIEEALTKNLEALTLLRQQGMESPRACHNYTTTAEAASNGGLYQVASAYQMEGLQYCNKSSDFLHAHALVRAASYLSLAGQSVQAQTLLEQALPLARSYKEQTGLQNKLFDLYIYLGLTLTAQQQFQAAETAYQEAAKLIGKSDNWLFLSAIHQGLSRSYLRQRKIPMAETELKRSIELAEQARNNIEQPRERGLFLTTQTNVYRTMVELQAEGKQAFDQAFDYAEIYRHRELLEALNKPLLSGATRSRPWTLQQVQEKLPANIQLVEYAVTERNLLIWFVTADRWTHRTIPIEAGVLQQLVTGYLQALAQQMDRSVLATKASELYRQLVAPIKQDLLAQRELVIVPDGVLHALPFAALVDPISERYLIEDYALVNSPSASVLMRLLEHRRTFKPSVDESLLILSNPQIEYASYPQLKPLLQTEREREAIQSLYPRSQSLREKQANKHTLLMELPNYEVVHLATHSLINEQNPLLSAILLSSNEAEESSELRTQEILQLNLRRTKLVILSSCRSGLIPQATDLGLGGVAQAFFSAGVPSVVASLWDVDDASTAELMRDFHYFHRRENKPFSEALRQAQLKLLHHEKWQHPYYWAAFQISGNGQTGNSTMVS